MTPYRKAPLDPRDDRVRTLDCVITSGEKHGWFKGIAGKMVAITVAVIIGQTFHVALAVIFALAGLWWIARDLKSHGEHVTIRTEGERVFFGVKEPFDVPFAALLDVRLDTRTTSKALNQARADGLNTIFGSAIPDGRSIQVDQSRIELVVEGRDPMLLSDEWISSTLAHENIRAIKVFLRRAGWLPLDD